MRLKRAIALLVMLVASMAFVACGSSDDDSGAPTPAVRAAPRRARRPSEASTAAPTTGCGSIPQQMPDDPDGVLAALPKDVQAAYNLFPQAVGKSAWADWKPAGSRALHDLLLAGQHQHARSSRTWQKKFDKLKAELGRDHQGHDAGLQQQRPDADPADPPGGPREVRPAHRPAALAGGRRPGARGRGQGGHPDHHPAQRVGQRVRHRRGGQRDPQRRVARPGPRPDHGRQGQRARDAGHPRRPGQRRRAQGRRQGVRGVRGHQGRRQAGRSVPARRGQGADAAVPRRRTRARSTAQSRPAAWRPASSRPSSRRAARSRRSPTPAPRRERSAYWNENKDDYEGVALGIAPAQFADGHVEHRAAACSTGAG